MLPLDGLRIIAVEQYGAGPYGTTHLADLGAEVIKLEDRARGGDMARDVGPYFLGEKDSQLYQSVNRNKKSLTVDLKSAAGREILHRLAGTADGLLCNLRGDQPEKLGITYDDLKSANRAIVCAHLSAYGRDGARKGWPGYDFLMQAESGFMSLSGEPDGPPARFGLSMVDFMTGLAAAFALVSGILAAKASGQGRDIDVSLFDVAMHQLSYPAVWYMNSGRVTSRMPRSAHPYIVPCQLYRTKDGWIYLMCQTHRFWELVCEKIGRADLPRNPDYQGYENRDARRDELTEIFDEALGARTTAEWVDHFAGEVPAAPVHDMAGALENPYFVERGGISALDHPDLPGLKTVASPFRMKDDTIPTRPGPKLGQHTDALLGELGYDAAAIQALKDQDVV